MTVIKVNSNNVQHITIVSSLSPNYDITIPNVRAQDLCLSLYRLTCEPSVCHVASSVSRCDVE